MSVKFNRIIHPNIQKELYVRHKALENRRGKYVPDTGVHFSDMATRATYAIMTTDYSSNSGNINKGLTGGEFFERGSSGFDNIIFESLFGFRKDGQGSYRNTRNDGIKPVCGLKSVTVEMNDTTGLRTATVQWSAPSLDSLRDFEDFLDFGTNVAIQFGWVYGNRQFPQTFIYYDDTLENIIVDREIYKNPFKKVIESYGNMDAVGGTITNFSSKLREDGGFDCETTVMGKGISFLSNIDGPTGVTITAPLPVKDKSLIDTIGSAIFKDPSVDESASESASAKVVSYNDIYHVIANLDLIVEKLLTKAVEATLGDENQLKKLADERAFDNNILGNTDEPEEVIPQESRWLNYLDDDGESLTNQFGFGEASTTSTYDSVQTTQTEQNFDLGIDTLKNPMDDAPFVIEPGAANMFMVQGLPNKAELKDKSNTRDYYVRWGWFEDNVLTKYLALINDDGVISQTFRSIQNGKSNLVSYNPTMIPTNFSDVFWASKNWNAGNLFQIVGEFKSEKEQHLANMLDLNSQLSSLREFNDNESPNYGRLRYCFVNVQLIQKAFGINTDTIDEKVDGFLKTKPNFKSIQNSIKTIMGYISDSLYGIPTLRITSESDNLMIVDNNLESTVSPKSFSNIEEESFNIFKFPSFEEGSIVKNQQMEISIPKKQAYASYLNAGGGISSKSDEIKESYRIYANLSGKKKHTDLPLAFKKPEIGVKNGNERAGIKHTSADNNFFGGLIELKKWRKIPEKSIPIKNDKTNNENTSVKMSEKFRLDAETGKLMFTPESKEEITYERRTVGVGTARYTETIETGIIYTPSPEGDATMSDMFLLDDTPSNTWLESVKMKPAVRQIIKSTLFDNTDKKNGGNIKSYQMRFIDLTLDIDGIGGLRPLSQFNVSYIQPRFNTEIFTEDGGNLGAPVFFVIKSMTQKIDDSGWTTSFGSIMQQNAEAYTYALDNNLFSTSNVIDPLSREFEQFQPESFLDKVKELLEPLSVAKNKFDNFMSDALDYQEQLETAGDISSDTPYSDAYQQWKTKRDEKKLDKQIEKDVKSMMKSLDYEPIGAFDVPPTMSDVDWLTEENRLEAERKKVGKMGITIPAPEYRPLSNDFTFSPEPVSLNSETANFIFEQNEYADNRDYFNNPDNYEIDDKYLSNKDPLTTMLTSAGALEMSETNLPGFGSGAEADVEQYTAEMKDGFSVYLPGVGHDMHVAAVNSKADVTELESDKDAGSQIEQKRGLPTWAQIKGFVFRKKKEEAEVKQAPPPRFKQSDFNDIYAQAEEIAKKFTDKSYEEYLMKAGGDVILNDQLQISPQVVYVDGTQRYEAVYYGEISHMIDEQTEVTYTLPQIVFGKRGRNKDQVINVAKSEGRKIQVIKYMKAQLMIKIGKEYGDLLGNQEAT